MDVKEDAQQECRTCREPIKAGARKCVRCDSFQDWRRFLTLSTSALALIIALVSVISALGPGIVRMLSGDRSELVVSYIATVDEGLLLLASNKGTRPAVIHGATLAARSDFIEFSLSSKGSDGDHVLVDSGQVQAITIVPEVIAEPEDAYKDFQKKETHDILVHATQFGGKKDTRPLTIPRGDLFPHVLEGKSFLDFEQALLDPYVAKNPHLIDGADPREIDRISPKVLDQLSPELIARLKKARVANRPKTLMER